MNTADGNASTEGCTSKQIKLGRVSPTFNGLFFVLFKKMYVLAVKSQPHMKPNSQCASTVLVNFPFWPTRHRVLRYATMFECHDQFISKFWLKISMHPSILTLCPVKRNAGRLEDRSFPSWGIVASEATAVSLWWHALRGWGFNRS